MPTFSTWVRRSVDIGYYVERSHCLPKRLIAVRKYILIFPCWLQFFFPIKNWNLIGPERGTNNLDQSDSNFNFWTFFDWLPTRRYKSFHPLFGYCALYLHDRATNCCIQQSHLPSLVGLSKLDSSSTSSMYHGCMRDTFMYVFISPVSWTEARFSQPYRVCAKGNGESHNHRPPWRMVNVRPCSYVSFHPSTAIDVWDLICYVYVQKERGLCQGHSTYLPWWYQVVMNK